MDYTFPVLFMGHGNPMNAVEDNSFTRGWTDAVKNLPVPKAIVCISAHWETKGTKVTAMEQPKMIYDMYGFPQHLYEVNYNAPGNPKLAEEIKNTVTSTKINLDHDWGFDHGTWSVLVKMFPEANIPCIQLSLDRTRDLNYHYQLAQELLKFRNKGVLFVASGNIVHNLRIIMQTANKPTDWAQEFDQKIASLIIEGNHDPIINYKKLGQAAELSVNSAEHYIPLIYALGLRKKNEEASFFNHNQYQDLMSMGMRCVRIG